MVRRVLLGALPAVALLAPAFAAAQQPSVTFGGFVDTYVAWDQGRPLFRDRSFTTQAARHAEFNINLAFLDAILNGDRVRGRLALQAGTSVQALYANEPSTGAISGGTLTRHVQEAVVGVRGGEGIWLDAGIFLSHLGTESWISRDNLTYTRSLIADYAPYSAAGVKITYNWTPTVTATAVLVNGWQNISENNGDKSIGGRIDWALSQRISLSYYNQVGNEQPDSLDAAMRFFNGLSARFDIRELTVTASVDGGRQDAPEGTQSWWGSSLVARLQMTERTTLAGRVEAFEDEHAVLINTGLDDVPFRAWGGSVGVDFEPEDGVALRMEFRALRARDPIFPDRGGRNGLSQTNMMFVAGLGVTF
jgi:hypothetical protein